MGVLAQAAADESVWKEYAVPLVAIVAAIAGALAGYLTRVREWRRERRHTTYAAYLDAYRAYGHGLSAAGSALITRQPIAVVKERLAPIDDLRRDYDHAHTMVLMIAGRGVLEAVDRLDNMVKKVVSDEFTANVRASPPKAPDVMQYDHRLTEALAGFVVAAGAEVGGRWGSMERSKVVHPDELRRLAEQEQRGTPGVLP